MTLKMGAKEEKPELGSYVQNQPKQGTQFSYGKYDLITNGGND